MAIRFKTFSFFVGSQVQATQSENTWDLCQGIILHRMTSHTLKATRKTVELRNFVSNADNHEQQAAKPFLGSV